MAERVCGHHELGVKLVTVFYLFFLFLINVHLARQSIKGDLADQGWWMK